MKISGLNGVHYKWRRISDWPIIPWIIILPLFQTIKKELQTHCRMCVFMQPTWSNGTIHCYKSNLDTHKRNKENEPTEPAKQTHHKKHTVTLPPKDTLLLRRELLIPKKKNFKQECRMCGVSEGTCFFWCLVVIQTRKQEDRTASIGLSIALVCTTRKKALLL